MKKVILLLILLCPISIKAIDIEGLYSSNVLLYDIDNQEIMYEKNSNDVINIASLTKIMTTIVAIENIKDLNETITISEDMLNEVPSDASVAGLKVGDVVTYKDLLYASILPSGADATVALAYGLSGSTSKFVNLMNEKATSLNLKNTHFVNTTGYTALGHLSTTTDVLQILLYALKNELFYEIFTTKNYILSNGQTIYTTLDYYNKENKYDVSNIIGSKTGFTNKAGLCMASLIKVKDKKLILLTLGAPKSKEDSYNIIDALTVIDYLNKNYQNKVIYKKGEILFKLPINNTFKQYYDVKVGKDIVVYDNILEEDKIYYEYDGLKELSYKNEKGSLIGQINYYYNDKVFSEDIYLDKDLNYSLNIYCLVPIIFVLLGIAIFKKKKD